APDPDGGPGGTHIKQQVAPDRRISLADAAMRHGRKRRAKPFNGFQVHCVLALARHGTRAGVGRPANEPAHAADAPRCANAPRGSRRALSTSGIKDGGPAIRGYARPRWTAAAMRRSVTSRGRPMM